jgi:hypothetical protein
MTEKIMTTGLTKLHAARGDVARMANMIARTNAEQHSKLAEIAALQSDLEAIVKKNASAPWAKPNRRRLISTVSSWPPRRSRCRRAIRCGIVTA